MRTNVKTIETCCKNCNGIFTKLFDSNRVQCSEQCKIEYRIKNKKPKKDKPIKICPKCGTEHTKDGTFCSRSCGNSRVRTEEFKQNLSKWAKANPRGFVVNPIFNTANLRPELGAAANKKKWDLLRQTLRCKECQKEFEVPYSQRNRKYCSIECSNKNKYHVNSNRKKTCIYNGYKMDSGAELVFAQQCDLHQIRWHKNTTQYFIFVDSLGKTSKYYPDFYLEQYDMWVEIKGRRYIRPDDELRRAAVGKSVFLIISNQFNKDFTKFKEFIGLIRP
jgi:hypothetical protein